MSSKIDFEAILNGLSESTKDAAGNDFLSNDKGKGTSVDSGKKTNQQEQIGKELLAALDALGGQRVKDDGITFQGDKFILPVNYEGDYQGVIKFLNQVDKAENTTFAFSRSFKFRPWDGAAAFQRALYRVFGTVGIGSAIQTMFGDIPPQYVSVATDFGKTEQVPWGKVDMPPLEASFYLGSTGDPEYGQLFEIHVEAPRRNRKRIEAFFDVIQDELEVRSIYRGKAFNGAETPEFLDLREVDESKVVYSNETLAQLNANIWGLIEHTATMRKLGIPLKRAVLLEGPFGTGKSLAGALTAQKARANGWTFILARPGKDDLFEVLNTAKLYAPAVVQFEDIDVVAKGGTDTEISKLLDALDGIGNKGNGVVAMFTTNHVENIQKAVMRPGRIDSIIHIGFLDRDGVEKLIKSVVNPNVLGDIDYDKVYAHMTDFLPAFVKEALDRAVRFAVTRTGSDDFVIETDDVVNAAMGLHTQLELMNAANEGPAPVPTLDAALRQTVKQTIQDETKKVVNATGLNGGRYNDFDAKVDERKLAS